MAAATVASYQPMAQEVAEAAPLSASVAPITPRSGAGGAAALEELLHFRRWSVFLPCAASSEVQQNTAYVRGRHIGNPKFFEQTRDRLAAVLHDRDILRAIGGAVDDADAENSGGTGFGKSESASLALNTVMQAQWTALGFASDRQFYKAFQLGNQSIAIVDALASGASRSSGGTDTSFLFWQLLVRANVGGAHARFGKQAEATTILRQGLQLAEDGAAVTTPREHVMLAALYAHLVRVCLEVEDLDEAQRLAELSIEAFERNIWELSEALEDRETQALVLASSYMTRGVCDTRKRRFDTGQEWFVRALECLEKHNADLGTDGIELRSMIAEQAEYCKALQL